MSYSIFSATAALPPVHKGWRIAQVLVWLAGAGLVALLLWFPAVGLLLFWNVLIPVAPALLVVATGLWRNVCPLASTVLLPRHLGVSARKKMPAGMQAWLGVLSIVVLLIIVPLRHAVFNHNGWATALLLLGSAATGIALSLRYDWKSGWCASLCPIHPVEKMYGSNQLLQLPNAHCHACVNCSLPCPDATPNMRLDTALKHAPLKHAQQWLLAGFPGFIWGWFQVPDHQPLHNWHDVWLIYADPVMGFGISLFLFYSLRLLLPAQQQHRIANLFAALAVSCYYWFRIPALLGFGPHHEDGLLMDLQGIIPAWTPVLIASLVVAFFMWWLLLRKPNKKSWLTRPAFLK